MNVSASSGHEGEDNVDAREAQILGKPQRIKSLALDELDAEAKEFITKMRQSLNSTTTTISDVFGLMLRHPGLFRCQMEMGIQRHGQDAGGHVR